MRASFADASGYLIRRLIRIAQSMPENSVRKAGGTYPAKDEATEFAMVKIISDEGKVPMRVLTKSTAPNGDLVETLYQDHKITAEVQFFRHRLPGVDAAGIAKAGSGAFSRACDMDLLLHSSEVIQLMGEYGLGYVGASPATDISALVGDATYEDRGRVDLTFTILNAASFLVQSMLVVGIDYQFQAAGGNLKTIHSEVSS